MAISLVLAANKVFDYNNRNEGDESDNKNDDPEPQTPPELDNTVENADTDNIFGPIETYIGEEPQTPQDITEPEPDDTLYDQFYNHVESEDVEDSIINEDIEETTEETTPEAQLAHNKETIKEAINNFESERKKLPPVIPTGRVKREDIKEIKEQGTRGFSVDVPEPINKAQEPKKFYFRRPR